ncbi:PREDICTED: Down syndrome critical region protein 3 homolog [Rhagoletis zephyria]|uniref:Down syndrome critical region protein 3 homolog n=1 Tax=Rhagoletis zephyria TaxID=28612 RepID=UPI0008115FA9|nr:PREDICTED: Down syndrome critical region protein 3 homolog [Rhagoletis zephyria]
MDLDIKLKRANKVYLEGENLTGLIVVDCKNDSKHDGIFLSVEATVNMQLSSKNVGLFEAFYNSARPIPLISQYVEVARSGKFLGGRTEIPFEVLLKPKQGRTCYETYHGVFISIQYYLKCELKRPLLNKDIQKVVEFMVEIPPPPKAIKIPPIKFVLTPDSLQNVKDKTRVPKFRISGRIDSTTCYIWEPFTGELIIEHCEQMIKSIELQLVRVETCGCAEGYACEVTEIQNIQIGDGEVARNTVIPIYMVFPRLFTCPTLITNNFKIEFEVKIVVILEDNHIITENIPIRIIRYSSDELQGTK